jgi:diguanylate cyclase (GGDEF)-like protein
MRDWFALGYPPNSNDAMTIFLAHEPVFEASCLYASPDWTERSSDVQIHCAISVLRALQWATPSAPALAYWETTTMNFQDIFETTPVSLWVEDFSGIRAKFEQLRAAGVRDLREHLAVHPEFVDACLAEIRVLEVNAQTLALFRASSPAVLKKNLDKVFRGDMKTHFTDDLLRMWHGTLDYDAEGVNYAVDGTRLDIHVSRRALPGHEHDWARALVSIVDTSERKRAREALEHSQQFAHGVFEHSPVSLWIEDHSEIRIYLETLRQRGITDIHRHIGEHPEVLTETMALIRVVDVNQYTLQLFEAPDKAALINNLSSVFRSEVAVSWKQELLAMWEGRQISEHEGVNYTLSGKPINVHVKRAPLPGAELSWNPMLIALYDITARKKAEANMAFLGTHDALTGLHNRAYFDSRCRRVVTENRFPISLLIADLNGLKTVNDSGGHQNGDALLKRAGAVLTQALQEQDTAARIGGDEFAVVLPYQDEQAARNVVRYIRELANKNNAANGDTALQFSIGYATVFEGTTLEYAYSLADKRMYEEKRKHYATIGVERRS